jgi:hypothetical protein
MATTAGRILKSDDVRLEGQFHLDIIKASSNQLHRSNVALAAIQAHIVENQSEFAVIEITCSCGTTMQLRCEYAEAKTEENP